MYVRWCLHFLFVGHFGFIDCHPFALGKDKLEKEVAILLFVHANGFNLRERERAVVARGVSARPNEDPKVNVGSVSRRETDVQHVAIFELEV